MKKTYIAPMNNITEMEVESMIATSDPKVINSGLDASQAESRSSNWFDDEDDDY